MLTENYGIYDPNQKYTRRLVVTCCVNRQYVVNKLVILRYENKYYIVNNLSMLCMYMK